MARQEATREFKSGDVQLRAVWLMSDAESPLDSLYGEQVCDDLDNALDLANEKDLNGEGKVYREEYDGTLWQVLGEYDSWGKYWPRD